ncbi:histidine phosphatase family protein [Comamonas piscis]|uniref:Histidine phosphatase family protein n=1 Tax=Comamonas piscis TaxID=1562974 RepID=A0A7G5EES3_9BURK|nr:histidine phosphatase family protein [Comamonas piscis]QMV72498.1 histidine phosphatase family protein [Comamonas piscis]WSO35269.1 histidine phosphatase family protein [Comamonas piscis]
MSALWLQRHAQPLVAPGVCYGRSNMAADDKATAAAAIALHGAWGAELLNIGKLWHSPLQRCTQLAAVLQAQAPGFDLTVCDDLAEMDFGAWEGQRWNDIARDEIQAWTADFMGYAPGGGESLGTMMRRVARALDVARQQALETGQPVLWISHAGVAQCAHWLLTRGDRVPLAKDWPSVKLAYGDWLRLPLLSNN